MASSKRLFFLIPSAVKSGFVDSAVALFLFHAAPGKGRKRLLVFWPNLSVEHPHLSVEHPIWKKKCWEFGIYTNQDIIFGYESERWRWCDVSKRRNLGNTTWPSANLAFLWFNGNGNRRQPGILPARFCFEGYYGFDVGQRSTLTRFPFDLNDDDWGHL